jgi:hypothetical protein
MRRASSSAFFRHVQKKFATILTQGEDAFDAAATTRRKLIVLTRRRRPRHGVETAPPSPGASRRAMRSTRAIA